MDHLERMIDSNNESRLKKENEEEGEKKKNIAIFFFFLSRFTPNMKHIIVRYFEQKTTQFGKRE